MSRPRREGVAVVTGASSGIGEALARRLAAAGWRVAVAARREERLEELARTLGDQAIAVPTDVATEDDRRRLFATVLERWGRVDLLVNNAGFGRYCTVESTALNEIRRLYDTNVLGLIHLSQLAVATMRQQGGGHIVNVASTAGHVAAPPLTLYASSKHAVVGFSRALHRELRGSGIHVTVVAPGPARSSFGRVASGRDVDPAVVPGGVSVERVARAIMSVIRRPRREAFVPAWYRAGVIVEYLFPRSVDLVAARIGARWLDG